MIKRGGEETVESRPKEVRTNKTQTVQNEQKIIHPLLLTVWLCRKTERNVVVEKSDEKSEEQMKSDNFCEVQWKYQ